MKKLLFAAVIGGLITLSSCSKDYTCVCSYQGSQVSSVTLHGTKSNVTTACNAGNTSGYSCSIQ